MSKSRLFFYVLAVVLFGAILYVIYAKVTGKW